MFDVREGNIYPTQREKGIVSTEFRWSMVGGISFTTCKSMTSCW